MAEETTSETVKKTSDGNVKLPLERYEELLAKAAEEKRPIYSNTYIEKSSAMQAADNKMWGAIWMGAGGTMFGIGLAQFLTGVRQAKALKG